MMFRGGRIPRGLSGGLRRLLQDHDRALQVAPALASESIVHLSFDRHGATELTNVPIRPKGVAKVILFTVAGTARAGGNLSLFREFPYDAGSMLAIVSDGTVWREFARTDGKTTNLLCTVFINQNC